MEHMVEELMLDTVGMQSFETLNKLYDEASTEHEKDFYEIVRWRKELRELRKKATPIKLSDDYSIGKIEAKYYEGGPATLYFVKTGQGTFIMNTSEIQNLKKAIETL